MSFRGRVATPNITVKLAILADDLSGACDTGVQFVDYGLGVHVCWHVDPTSEPAEDVLVLSTTSRSHAPEAAAAKVRDAHVAIVQSGRCLIYKKMDSTLKGNVGAEIDAVLERGPQQLALVCPAFPDMGRRLVNGELLLGEECHPSGQHLPTLLRDQSTYDIDEIQATEVDRGGEFLLDRLRHAMAEGTRICCADAEDNADLANLAEAVLALLPDVLPVGSASLAAQLARRIAGTMEDFPSLSAELGIGPEKLHDGVNPTGPPIVCFVGSHNPVTTRQLVRLAQGADLMSMRLDDHTPSDLSLAVGRGQHVVIRIGWENGTQTLLENVLTVLAKQKFSGLVLTGGDTAKSVCDSAGVTGIQLQQQVLPGLAKGRLVGGRLTGTAVVTKAGGFGDDDALLEVFLHLTAR